MDIIKRSLPNQLTAEDGQSLVEFALVTIFIITPLLFGIIEGSMLMYKYVSLANAAREGARTGSIYLYVGDPGGSSAAADAGRSAAIYTSIDETLAPGIVEPVDCNGSGGVTSCQITYDVASPSADALLRSTSPLTVTLTHTHSILFGAFGGELNMQAQASMKIEPSTVVSGAGP